MMPSTEEEKAAKRAAQLKRLAALPEHLRLGVTLPGMRALLSELPSDKLERVNAHVEKVNAERVKKGKPAYPKNEAFNGYCYQYWITQWAKEAKEGQPDGDGLAVCERLRQQGSPHVGEATVFVSWFLATPIETLLDALANFLKEKGLREEDTFFWVCDYVIRQTNVDPDLALLGECVSAVGHTVLLMEPWHAPAPLERAYCITEVYHTQKSGAQFDVVMSSAQQDAFETALVDDFDSIETSLSKVDVRTATCLKPEETTRILDELERAWASPRATRWSSACCARRWSRRRGRRWRGCRRPSGGRLCCSTCWAGCCRTCASWTRRGRCLRRCCRRSGRRWATATRARWPRSATWATC